MVRVSRKFIEAVKLANRPAYRIAWEADLHPVLLSKLIHGADKVYPRDRRILRVARILGLKPEECFEEEPGEERNFAPIISEVNRG
jgi:hypothetical protein